MRTYKDVLNELKADTKSDFNRNSFEFYVKDDITYIKIITEGNPIKNIPLLVFLQNKVFVTVLCKIFADNGLLKVEHYDSTSEKIVKISQAIKTFFKDDNNPQYGLVIKNGVLLTNKEK